MTGITMDWTITFGNLITVVGMVFSGLFVFFMMRADILLLSTQVKLINEQISVMQTELKNMVNILTLLARQDERIKNLETTVIDLKHGKGFTFELSSPMSSPYFVEGKKK